MRERELKFEVGPRFELPPLDDIDADVVVVPRERQELETEYHDSSDLRLTRWGVSLRYRQTEGWTVKLPRTSKGAAVERDEISFPGPPGRPPRAAIDLLTAFLRRERPSPLIRMRTVRTGVDLYRDEEVAVEVVDDRVVILDGDPEAGTFREVEAEATADDGTLLDRVDERLRSAGAGESDPAPKVVRALGERAPRAPEVVVPDLPQDATVSQVIRAALASSVSRVLAHDAGVRLDEDPEDVHQARVGTRRLRSDLRTFSDFVESTWADPLGDYVRWLGGLLGEVRDADVLGAWLREAVLAISEDDAAGVPAILKRLANQREDARTDLMRGVRGERYLGLLDRLVNAARVPVVTPSAEIPASDAADAILERPWKRFRKAVRKLGPEPSDEQLHRVRIRAKRTRYAAEALEPVLGKEIRRFAKAAARVQEVLGDHQDAVVTQGWLRRSAMRSGPRAAFAAGRLAGVAAEQRLQARKRFPDAWDEVMDRRPSWV
jgi:CHAD domain-containing protein